ncbi:hypothetical protein AB4P95_07775 [Pseudomonas sp. A1437]|jgi:hypothetical protein|uniref:hypothetical protein n=1 Tax=Pseudomonas TaxID=286 RepID=UPI00190CF04F|nr:hypothetical protein [Pseudomonas rhodesiae]MBK3481547.1 hypothetical protein [Pseudomonas fluorescens]MDN6863906.1 hypothetical protein [Pseudomonas rhodesiae]
MNAPHRSDAIYLAQKRISELELEISTLRREQQSQREIDFMEKLKLLMQKFSLQPAEVIAVLELRGDLDRKLFSCETTYKLKHILGLKEVDASHRPPR